MKDSMPPPTLIPKKKQRKTRPMARKHQLIRELSVLAGEKLCASCSAEWWLQKYLTKYLDLIKAMISLKILH
eukprot:Skav230476  [mRNA]  locus=scaffold1445:75077:75292:- [translate_table: standard]